MICSMTAFSRQQLDQDWGTLTWEIRSVNHRYLEPSIRLPESFRALESQVRDVLRKRLSRGKVECQLRFQASQAQQDQLHLNQALIKQIHLASNTVKQIANDVRSPTTTEVLKWPGVITEEETDVGALQEQAMSLFGSALDDLILSRAREGAELGKFIQQRLESIAEIVKEVRTWMPDIIARQKQNIVDRLADLIQEIEPTRLEQELVMLAQKSDVDEELDRLEAHLGEVTRVLAVEGQKGRRLDFLMQELNREANTLSSKSVVAETTRSAVELKVLIEQMREQIQNIE
jgi:uncharacterized protein (TIGR00255 family)